jgi:hypothetical protein
MNAERPRETDVPGRLARNRNGQAKRNRPDLPHSHDFPRGTSAHSLIATIPRIESLSEVKSVRTRGDPSLRAGGSRSHPGSAEGKAGVAARVSNLD